jgi:glucose-1-phosphate thymidylyltransferase
LLQPFFNAVNAITPSTRGELEITDAIQWLIDQSHPVSYYLTQKPNMDVGTVERWLQANRFMLDEVKKENYVHESVILDNCKIIPPVLIDKRCVLKECIIGPYVSVSSDCNIEGCRIENSIILNKVNLKKIASPIKNTVISFNSTLVGL